MAEDVTIPAGEPDESWTHDELDAWAESEGIGPLSGTKAEKLEQVALVTEPPAPSPEAEDVWADRSLTIPVGASGPMVAHYRAALGLDDGSDEYDARMRSRVREFQRRAGLPETGRLDPETRRFLN